MKVSQIAICPKIYPKVRTPDIFHAYLMKHSLKLRGTNYHFNRVKIPGTATCWKAWIYTITGLFLIQYVYWIFCFLPTETDFVCFFPHKYEQHGIPQKDECQNKFSYFVS
jgi:hypothetical protein